MIRWALAAWAALVFGNAIAAHRVDPAWVLGWFWPATGSPGWAGFLAAQARNLRALAILGGLDVLALVAGGAAVRWARGRVADRARAGMIRLVLGLGLLGGLAAAAGLAGLADSRLAFAAAFVTALGLAPRLRRFRAAGLPAPRWFLALAAVMAVGVLGGALAPDITMDALRQYLELPHRALQLHRLIADPERPMAWTPHVPVGLNLLALGLGAPAVAKLLNWQAWLFVALWLAGGPSARPRPGGAGWWPWVAAAAWLCLLNVPLLAQTAMPDCQLVLAVTLGAWLLFAGGHDALAGAVWAVALETKVQAGLYAGVALAACALARRRVPVRALAAALLVHAPWLVRAWLESGQALAPFWMPEPGGAGRHLLPAYFRYQFAAAAPAGAAAVLARPFALATRLGMWDALLSPALVVAMAAAVAARLPAAWMLFIAGGLCAWAGLAGQTARYLLPLAPALLAAAAAAGARLAVPAAGRRAALALLAWEAGASFHWGYRSFNPVGVALGRESPALYLRRMLAPRPETWDDGAALRQFLGPATRYYLASRLEAYYWPGLPVLDVEGEPPRVARWAAAAPGRIGVALRQHGVAWLVDEEGRSWHGGLLVPRWDAWEPRALAAWGEFFRRHAVLRARLPGGDGTTLVYELVRRPGAARRVARRLPATGP